jgi:hypoxanthine-DNA glycosylase
MPSVTSLHKAQYYGHPTNAFWPIMELLCGYPLETYEKRVEMIISHRLALWDVLASCERESSADQAIRAATPNDIAGFLASRPSIGTIICNGSFAMKMFIRHITLRGKEVSVIPCPSTSAANTIGFELKARQWLRELGKALEMS